MFKQTQLTLAGLAIALMVGAANAAILVPVAGLTGSNGGDQYGPGMPGLIDQSGVDTTADPTDPSQWTHDGSGYQTEWMPWYFKDGAGAVTTGSNGKIAWAVFDLGAPTPLETMYVFNSNYGGGATGAATFNVYHSNAPSVALPAQPNKNQFANTGASPQGDYDFHLGGGWTQRGGTVAATKSGTDAVDMTGVTAQYVAIEILTNYGDTYKGGRSGLDEVVFTQAAEVPEPASMLTGLLGMGLIALRRKH